MEPLAYKYGIRAVLSDPAVIRQEIWAAHNLYNDLVRIERTRREETRAFWAELGGYTAELEKLAAAITAVQEIKPSRTLGHAECKAARKEAWKHVQEIRVAVATLERQTIEANEHPAKTYRRQRTKELVTEAKARGQKLSAKEIGAILDNDPKCLTPRDQLRLSIAKEYEDRGVKLSAKTVARRLREAGLIGPTEAIEEKARAAAYAAYQARGVTPGTRAIVTEAHTRSLQKLNLREQRFAKWAGAGSFGVQIQGGVTVEALFGGEHSQVQLRKLEDTGHTQRGSRRSGRQVELSVRIGSDEKRRPLWAKFAMLLHRPLPPGARVTEVKVLLSRDGLHDTWEVVFAFSAPEGVYRCKPGGQKGVVAVDIGWRSHEGDLRVGYMAGSDGVRCELTPPSFRNDNGPFPFREKLRLSRDLQEIQQRNFFTENKEAGTAGGVLHELAMWLDANKAILPEWLIERTQAIRQWRSQLRLNRLIEDWLANRFPGDNEAIAFLDVWRRKWRHLFDWEANNRAEALRARKEHYRAIAHQLATRYETIIINDADLATTRRRKPADKAEELVMIEDRKRSQAFDAAPGELREEILRAANKFYCNTIKKPFDSETCHACGVKCEYDRAAKITHTCEHCDTTWDQDCNATLNALGERFRGDKTPDPARVPQKPAKPKKKRTPPSRKLDAHS